MRLIAAAAAAQRDIALAPRAYRAGSALLDDLGEEVDAEVLGAFAVVETEFDGVLLGGEETGKLEDVMAGDVGVDVEVGETGGGGEEEDGVGEDATEDTGMLNGGVAWGGVEVEVEVEDGLGAVVVLDAPVIVNCGLLLPESPNTSWRRSTREVRTRQHDVRALCGSERTTHGRRCSGPHQGRSGQ